MNTANIGAYNIAAAAQNSGKANLIVSNPAGENITSFQEALKKYFSDANANINPSGKGAAETASERFDYDGETADDISRTLEMLGVPQDIISLINNYFTRDILSGGAAAGHLANFIDEISSGETIPGGVKQKLDEFALMLKTADESGVFKGLSNNNSYADYINVQAGFYRGNGFDNPAHADYGMRERAELMTKALANLDGAGKAKTDGITQTGQRLLTITETSASMQIQTQTISVKTAATIEDMFYAMRKTPGIIVNADVSEISQGKAAGFDFVSISGAEGGTDAAAILEQTGTAKLNPEETGGTLNDTHTGKPDGVQIKTRTPSETEAEKKIIAAGDVNLVRTQAESQKSSVSMAQAADEISKIIAENINTRDIADASEIFKGELEGEFEIKLKLSPRELGELSVKVLYDSVKGSVVLDIAAANKAAESGILSRISDLRESLASRGVNLENVEVNGGTLEHGGQSGRNGANHNRYDSQNSQNSQNGGNNRNNGNSGFNLNYAQTSEIRETARREMIMNHMRSRRLFYQTV